MNRSKMLNAFFFCCLTVISSFGQIPSAKSIKDLVDSLYAAGGNKNLTPGLGISILRNDSIILSNGYGQSDVKNNTPVDPSITLFQLGSVGKLFTAIAVLQQVEAGKLDLHTDINRYLKEFQVEGKEPITLIHLLTHTAGFSDHVIGYAAKSTAELQPLGQHLKTHLPDRMLDPGLEINYSNYSYALAGYLVECVTGETFTDYIRDHILEPLNMAKTTYLLPDDYQSKTDYAKGYLTRNDFVEVKSYPRHPTPAGSILSTVNDMTLLMKEVMHPTGVLLNNDTWSYLFTRQFSSHPDLMGYSLGLEEQIHNGTQGFAKGGSVPGFLSMVHFYPKENLAFFIATNTQTDNFMELLSAELSRRLLPPGNSPLRQSSIAERDEFSGTYTSNRTNPSTIEELVFLFSGRFDVLDAPDGRLKCYTNGAYHEYQPVAASLFQCVDKPAEFLYFDKGEDGTMRLYRNANVGGVYVPGSLRKVKWYDGPEFINEYYFFVVLVIWTFILVVPYRLWVLARTKWSPTYVRPALLPRTAYYAALAVVFLYTWQFFSGFLKLFRNSQEFFFGVPSSFRVVQYASYLIPIFVALMVIACYRLWATKTSTTFRRVYYTIITVASLIHLVFLFRWHFIGLNV